MADRHPPNLHALIYAGGALLLIGQAFWFYLVGDYRRILLPALLAPLMLLAALLRLDRQDGDRLSTYLTLACGYLLIAVELPHQTQLAPLWLGLPPVLTLVLLPLGPATLLNLGLAPAWLMLLGEGQLNLELGLSYLTLVVIAGLAPWEILRQQALLKATDPIDPECPALGQPALYDQLRSECERADLLGQRLSVVLIHLPQLEMAGEQFGSRARRTLLDTFCHEIDRLSREHDLLGRASPTGFWLVLPDTSEHGALLVRQRIDQALQRIVLLDTGPLEARMAIDQLRPNETPERFAERLQARGQRLAGA